MVNFRPKLDNNTRLTPLTVNLGEFAAQINEENREILQFGAFFQWDAQTRRQHNVPMGPENPQALNRYAYCLNNPLRYVDPTGHYHLTMADWAAYASRIDTRIHRLEHQAYWIGGISGIAAGAIAAAIPEVASLGLSTPLCVGIFTFVGGAVGLGVYELAGGADAWALQKALDYINTAAADLNAMGITEFELDIHDAYGTMGIRYCEIGRDCGRGDPYSYYKSSSNVVPDLSIHQAIELTKILNVPLSK